MRRLLLAAALTATLAVGAAATTTQATPLPQAATCSGVWVVVDFGSLGGTSTKCATSYGTGTKALRSAGFSVTLDSGFVLTINGKPGNPDPNTAYWSYWHAAQKSDGSWGTWSYSGLGADSYHPGKGEAEGWRYQKLSDGKVSPGTYPPVVTSSPKPTATKTTSKPTATKKTTKAASASPTKTATTKKKTTTPSPTANETPSPTPTATEATPLGAGDATAVAQEQVTEAPQDTGGGSPVGLAVAGGAVVLAAGGLGIWWLRKGRKP